MRTLAERAGWAVAGALAIILVGTLARATEGGPLDPPGPTGSTLRALDKLVPSWSMRLPSDDAPGPDNCNSTRFECVLSDTAVLDKETGLVWERQPGISTINNWFGAMLVCESKLLGGLDKRGGWHLPTIEELSTLVPFPTASPFDVSQTDEYWSSTTDTFDSTKVLTRVFGTTDTLEKTRNTVGARIWCVRGGATPGS
jgi:hypothetical protein